jgi:hypothetical protein
LTQGAVIPFAAHITAIRRNHAENIMGRSKTKTAAIVLREVATGDLQGIAGKNLDEIEGLEIGMLPAGNEAL